MRILRIHLDLKLKWGPPRQSDGGESHIAYGVDYSVDQGYVGRHVRQSQADLCCYYPSSTLIWMSGVVLPRGRTSQPKPTDLSNPDSTEQVPQEHYGRLQDDKYPSART
jgi:hypothetical protein